MAKKIEIDYGRVEELASLGYNIKNTYEAIGICSSKAFADVQFMEAHKRGYEQLRKTLSEKILGKAADQEDTTMQIFLSKRLGLFEKAQPQLRLQSTGDALKAFEEVFNSDLSIEAKTALKGVLESFTRAYEVTEQEKRIQELEAQIGKIRQ